MFNLARSWSNSDMADFSAKFTKHNKPNHNHICNPLFTGKHWKSNCTNWAQRHTCYHSAISLTVCRPSNWSAQSPRGYVKNTGWHISFLPHIISITYHVSLSIVLVLSLIIFGSESKQSDRYQRYHPNRRAELRKHCNLFSITVFSATGLMCHVYSSAIFLCSSRYVDKCVTLTF